MLYKVLGKKELLHIEAIELNISGVVDSNDLKTVIRSVFCVISLFFKLKI